MTVSFRDLKRNSSSTFEKLNKELSKLNQPSYSSKDDRLWSCQTDKAGNGSAIIRFLPARPGEDTPFARVWSHGFKGPTGLWYIEKSLTTIGKEDPVGALNNRLWNSGLESDKATAREQKRQLNYYSNIYVVKDPANPENEGKVFLFRYGKKIFEKLNDLMNPVEDPLDQKDPINPFDFWEGANFKLRIRRVEGYANYDKSEFETPGPLADDDKMEEIWKSQYSLEEFLDPKTFKTYEELQKQLSRVLETGAAPVDTDDTPPFTVDAPKQRTLEAQPIAEDFGSDEVVVDDEEDDEEDDIMAEFRRIAGED